MEKTTLLGTAFAEACSLNEQAKLAIPFLIKNLKLVQLTDDDLKVIQTLRSITTSPISNIFRHILDADKLDIFMFMEFTKVLSNDLPEVLTMDTTIDGLRIKGSVPNQLKKIWVNLTPIMNVRRMTNSTIIINDLNKLQNLVVRGSLVRSYDAADAWLTPKIAAFIIESYSITIASLIKRTYNLDLEVGMFVQTLFAIYYSQLLGSKDDDLESPPLLNRCGFLGSGADIQRRLELIRPFRDNDGKDLLIPSKICDILTALGPGRLKSFNINNLYRFISMGPMESHAMMIAIDYPPYWVHQVLKVLSGEKNSVLSNILKMRSLQKKAEEFIAELNYSRFVENLNK